MDSDIDRFFVVGDVDGHKFSSGLWRVRGCIMCASRSFEPCSDSEDGTLDVMFGNLVGRTARTTFHSGRTRVAV